MFTNIFLISDSLICSYLLKLFIREVLLKGKDVEVKCTEPSHCFYYHCHSTSSANGVTTCINCMGFEILTLSEIYLHPSYFEFIWPCSRRGDCFNGLLLNKLFQTLFSPYRVNFLHSNHPTLTLSSEIYFSNF